MWKLVNPIEDVMPAGHAALVGGVAAAPGGAVPGPRLTYKYTTPIISSYAMTAHAMADVGFGGILNVNTTGDVYYFVIDVAAFTSKVDIKTAADDKTSIITRYGIGFRVAVVAWNIEVSASANLGLVAASGQVKGGQSSILAHAFAGDISVLGGIAGITKFNGTKFDAQTLKDLAGFVAQLAGVIAKTGATIAPAAMDYGVLNPNVYSPDKVAASNGFAIEQLCRNTSRSKLDDWLAGGGREDWRNAVISPTVVAAAYANFGVTGYTDGGTPDQVNAAKAVQGLGT
jgi:hypothetical protein